MKQSKKQINLCSAKDCKIALILVVSFVFGTASYAQSFFIPESPKLAMWELGNAGETIVILHGGPSVEHSYLRPEWDTLASVATIYYYDQRGCGESDTAKTYTWIDHINDLKRIKETVSRNDKFILAGSSWGSELALLYSIYYPEDVKGLILSGFCNWLGTNTEKTDLFNYNAEALYYFESKGATSDYLDSVRNAHSRSREEIEKIREMEDPEKELKERLNTYVGIAHSQTMFSRKAAPELGYIKKIEAPILAFGGTLICNYEDWSDVLEDLNSGTQRVVIENSCHDPWFTHTDEFFKECFQFIAELNN